LAQIAVETVELISWYRENIDGFASPDSNRSQPCIGGECGLMRLA
jgi:hypothetical protein